MARLLVVDDHAIVTDAYRALFEAMGHEVVVAASVDEAVRCCTDAPPDLMLLDITLGREHGLDVLDRLRAGGIAVPITAALTGHDDADVARRCAEAGCVATLVKPVPARELLRRVEEWTS